MKILQICYDLKNASEERYQNIIEAINRLGNAEHAQLSVWILRTNLSANRVRDILSPHMRQTDSLLVTEITAMASHNVPDAAFRLVKEPGINRSQRLTSINHSH